MELRNRKRLRYDHSTYIPSEVDDDSFETIDNNVYLAFGMYIFFIGIISFAVMACNMKYINKPFTQPLMVVVPNVRHTIIQPLDTLTYLMKNSTKPQQHLQKQQFIEGKTRIYSVFIQTSNHSSSYELYWNRHRILKELILNANNKKQLDWINPTLKKYISNFNSCFIRMNEYSQSNIVASNTNSLISSKTFISTTRPTEFIDITIISGNQKINASQSIITIYDSCV
jgi:hypothetical protein